MKDIEKTNTNDIVNSIGLKIYKLRKENNMTQEDLAKAIYVSNKTISKWENGYSSPSYGSLKDIAKVFKVKVSYFLDDKTPKGRIKFFFKVSIEFTKTYWHQLIFTILFVLLSIYFINTFDTLAMYEIVSDDNVITFDAGYFVRSKSNMVITINNINYTSQDDDIINQKIKLYTVDHNDKIYFYESDNLKDIYFKDLMGYKINRTIAKNLNNSLYIEIENLHKDNSLTSHTVKLGLKKTISSDKLYDSNVLSVNNETSIDSQSDINEYKLIHNGYTKIDNSQIFYKDFKNYRLYFELGMEKMFYTIETKKEIYSYSYFYNKDMIELIAKDSTIKKMYAYAKKDNILNCSIGDCSNYLEVYEEILKVYNKAFS